VIEMGTAGIVLAHGLVQGAEIGDHVQEGMIVKVLGDPLFMLFRFRYGSHINSTHLVSFASPSVVIISITMFKFLWVMRVPMLKVQIIRVVC